MVKQIIWSPRAQSDRLNILEYWFNRNKSKNYSRHLNQIFIESTQIIRKYPYIGKQTDIENVRIKIIKDYLMTYKISENYIEILTIWDSRQDDENFFDLINS
jgi:toxin YoeB